MSVEDPVDVQVDLDVDDNSLRAVVTKRHELEVDDLDVDDNSLRAVVTKRHELEVDDLFVDGELRLWEDEAGWSGYVREEIDDATVYFRVNTRFDEERWIDRTIVGEQAVRESVRQHIRDPLAGGAGTFRRGCSPP